MRGPGEADAGVVDQHVEAVGHLVGERAHRIQRSQVADHEPHVAGSVEQPAERLAAPLLAAGVGEDRGPFTGEAGGQCPPEAVGGSGDEDRVHR